MQSTTTGPLTFGASESGTASNEAMPRSAQGATQGDIKQAADAPAGSQISPDMKKAERLRRRWMKAQDAWVGRARERVRTHPIASVAIGLGVGVLLDRFTSR